MESVALITEADYRNVVIFPEKFDGLYARLDVRIRKSLPGPSGYPFLRICVSGDNLSSS